MCWAEVHLEERKSPWAAQSGKAKSKICIFIVFDYWLLKSSLELLGNEEVIVKSKGTYDLTYSDIRFKQF